MKTQVIPRSHLSMSVSQAMTKHACVLLFLVQFVSNLVGRLWCDFHLVRTPWGDSTQLGKQFALGADF